MRCASWPCAAPPTASMSRCAHGATAGPGRKSGTPAMRSCSVSGTTPAAKAGARRRPARRPPGQRLACGVCRDPFLHRLPEARRRAILAALRLARELGPKPPPSPTRRKKAVLHYAREHNLGKIVIGRQSKRRWWDRSGFADRLARHAPDLDLVVIALDEKPFPLPHAPATAVRRWKSGACSCRAARWRWRYAPSLPRWPCSG